MYWRRNISDPVSIFLSDPSNPILITYSKQVDWLRALLELYYERPTVHPSLFFHGRKDFLIFKLTDRNLVEAPPNVIFLYSDPVHHLFSLCEDQGFIDESGEKKIDIPEDQFYSFISKESEIYTKHLTKWLVMEKFTRKKTLLNFELLKEEPFHEFEKIHLHFTQSRHYQQEKLSLILEVLNEHEIEQAPKYLPPPFWVSIQDSPQSDFEKQGDQPQQQKEIHETEPQDVELIENTQKESESEPVQNQNQKQYQDQDQDQDKLIQEQENDKEDSNVELQASSEIQNENEKEVVEEIKKESTEEKEKEYENVEREEREYENVREEINDKIEEERPEENKLKNGEIEESNQDILDLRNENDVNLIEENKEEERDDKISSIRTLKELFVPEDEIIRLEKEEILDERETREREEREREKQLEREREERNWGKGLVNFRNKYSKIIWEPILKKKELLSFFPFSSLPLDQF